MRWICILNCMEEQLEGRVMWPDHWHHPLKTKTTCNLCSLLDVSLKGGMIVIFYSAWLKLQEFWPVLWARLRKDVKVGAMPCCALSPIASQHFPPSCKWVSNRHCMLTDYVIGFEFPSKQTDEWMGMEILTPYTSLNLNHFQHPPHLLLNDCFLA